ncbi:hypothetical protein C8J56DRAFT_899882 [Mycena floridula]|nr:hypothetical protein C8J56DRAFT_899882 [Mycena floridula]
MFLKNGFSLFDLAAPLLHPCFDLAAGGSAKTRHLVLAIRDHLFERIERRRIREIDDEDKPLVNRTGKNTDPPDEKDPEAHDLALGEPLQDAWSVDLLQVKDLRYLSEALDKDGSGFTTISEINIFTETRPVHWSLPRWISFWTVGWPLSAQKYCTEIEQTFHEMSSLRRDIGVRMPGNHVYISQYLDAVWHKVIGLTSSFFKPDLPNVPLEEYQDYIFGRETLLRKRLENISYSIETAETVHLITGKTNIERQCLNEEIHHGDVMSSIVTVTYVIDAVWIRYMAIVDSGGIASQFILQCWNQNLELSGSKIAGPSADIGVNTAAEHSRVVFIERKILSATDLPTLFHIPMASASYEPAWERSTEHAPAATIKYPAPNSCVWIVKKKQQRPTFVLGSLPLNRHLVVKMRSSLLLKNHFEFELQARACLDSINDRYIRSTFGANEICMICDETRISLPAWYCVECSSATSVQPERPAWAEEMLMDIQDVQDQVNSSIASMELRMDNMEQRITRRMEEIMTAAMMGSA